MRYMASPGEIKTIRVDHPDERTLICPEIKPRELFEYRSVFLPPNGIDSVGKVQTTYPGGDSFTISLPAEVSGRYLALVFPNSTSAYISFMELEVYGY